jgi:hypothetical protein
LPHCGINSAKARIRYLDANRLRLHEFPYVVLHLIPIHDSLFSLNPLPNNEFSSNSQLDLVEIAINIVGPTRELTIKWFDGKYVLRLTDDLWQKDSAFLTDQIALREKAFEASFSTYFQFQITDLQGISDGVQVQGADGIVFVIQNQARNVSGVEIDLGYGAIRPIIGI